jgi:tetratricopeptide (TPR) repeat protein
MQMQKSSKRLFGGTQIPTIQEWVGREELLAKLAENLSNQRKVLAIHGEGGIGKTAIIVKLLEQYGINPWCSLSNGESSSTISDFCPYDNVMYCKANNSDSFNLFGEFFKAFGLPANFIALSPEQTIDTIVKKLQTERWLIAIDNIEDLLEPYTRKCKSAAIGNLLHALVYSEHKSKIIIIGQRLPELDLADRNTKKIDPEAIDVEEICGISPSASIQLLEDLGAKDHQIDLDWIADRVGGHIFALKLLADYSKRHPGELRQKSELVTKEIMPLLRAYLDCQKSPAKQLLKRMSVLRRKGITAKKLTILRLLRPYCGKIVCKRLALKNTDTLLAEFVNCGLVEKSIDPITGEDLYILHRSVSETLQTLFRLELPELWSYAAKMYSFFKLPKQIQSLEDWQFRLEKLYFCWLLRKYDLVSRVVVRSLLPSLQKWNQWDLQQEWCQRLIPHVEGSTYQYCLQTLGCVYRDTGRLDEAERYFKDSLAYAQRQKSPREIAKSIGLLGDIARYRGEYDEANVLYRRSLQLLIELGDRAGVAICWASLGENELEEGNFAAAEIHLKKALVSMKNLKMAWHIAEINWALSKIYRAKGDLKQSQIYYDIAATLFSKIGAKKDLAKISCSTFKVHSPFVFSFGRDFG